ncbi:glycosyltransferase family 8 protein [Halomonadaceae bacterium KBTZ08]
MSTDPIHIASCCDEGYAPFVTVMMTSTLSNHHGSTPIHFHFVSDNVSEVSLEAMRRNVEHRGGTLHVYPADNLVFSELPTSRFGLAAYQRIMLAQYLPASLSRIVYIDADTLVLGDVEALWRTDIGTAALAAVEDLSRSASETIGIARSDYFNSGVLIQDLDQWRRYGLHHQVAEYAANHAHQLKFMDQCSLNAVFNGDWHRLHPGWNQQATIHKVIRKYAQGSGYSRNTLKQAIATPQLIHFTGPQKPWHYGSFHPERRTYQYYLQHIDWPTPLTPQPSFTQRLAFLVRLGKHIKLLRNHVRKRYYQLTTRSQSA